MWQRRRSKRTDGLSFTLWIVSPQQNDFKLNKTNAKTRFKDWMSCQLKLGLIRRREMKALAKARIVSNTVGAVSAGKALKS